MCICCTLKCSSFKNMNQNCFNNIGDIIADANYITEKALLPLSAIRTESDKTRYEKKGYLIGYTYDEWPEKYPQIPRDNVYYVCGLNVGTVYYDKKNVVYLDLRIYGREMLSLGGTENYEETMLRAIHKQEEHSKKGEYGHLFLTMPDGIRMDAMNHLLDLEGPTERFYGNFMGQYAVSNFLCKNISKRVLNALRKSKSDKQKAATQERLELLYGDKPVITVYRGEADGSTEYSQAMSWSPDINVAYFFATRLGKDAKIRIGKLYRKDVLEYFPADGDEGAEEEIITMPGKVKNVRTEYLLDADSEDVLRLAVGFMERYTFWRDETARLHEDADNSLNAHDALHAVRVLFLSMVLGAHEKLRPEEMEALCAAAVYHDIGRTHDGDELDHGRAGAEYYHNEATDVSPIAEAVIELHCAEKEAVERELARRFSGRDLESAQKILRVLEDADALDRVRFGLFGMGSRDGLDVRRLQCDFARKLVPLAMQCLRGLSLGD